MTPAPRRLRTLGPVAVGHLRRRMAGEDGLGLVEIMIAIFVLSVAVLGLATSASGTLTSLRGSRDRQQATIAAAQTIEVARAYPYQRLAHRTGEAPVAGPSPQYDADLAGTAVGPEDLVIDPAGGVRSADTSHFGTSAGRTVTTYVTWVNVNGGLRNAKRVTAVVTWGTGGRSVRQSTVVSAADSGLLVADFDVNPRQRQAAPLVGTTTRCFLNTITNQGQTDRYDVLLHSPTPPNYTVTAHRDANGNGVADPGEQITALSPDGRPRTPQVDTNQSVPVLVCYQPGPGAQPTGDMTVTFRSVARPTQDPKSVVHWVTHPASFTAAPVQVTLTYDGGNQYCHQHAITNSGEPDRYRFGLPAIGGYAVSVHVDQDGNGIYEVALTPNVDGFIETQQATPTGAQARVSVCYQYQLSGEAPQYSAVVTVASRFNPDVTVSLTHQMVYPPPVFALSTPVQTAQVGPQSSPCFLHTLTNQGVRSDSYGLVLPSVSRYTVRAFLDSNANGIGETAEQITGATPSVAPNGTLRLLVCYQLTNGSNSPFTTTVTVRSLSDASVTRAAQHTATVSLYQLFLHDVNNTQNHGRTFGAVYTMDHDATAQTVLYDYDSNVSGNDGRPGAYVSKDFNTDNALRWQYTFGSTTTLGGASDLRLWSSYNGALGGSSNIATVRPVVEYLRRGTDGSLTSLATQTFIYTHNVAGWQQNTFTTTLPSITFQAGQSLVLRVYCASGAGEHCNFAYDTTNHLAALTVRTAP